MLHPWLLMFEHKGNQHVLASARWASSEIKMNGNRTVEKSVEVEADRVWCIVVSSCLLWCRGPAQNCRDCSIHSSSKFLGSWLAGTIHLTLRTVASSLHSVLGRDGLHHASYSCRGTGGGFYIAVWVLNDLDEEKE
jgi:hypothetical protein